MAAFPRAYRSSATHRNGGTAGHRRATPSQTTGRTYSDVGTGIHNAKVEGIKEGGELPRLCNFIAESAIRFLSKLSCRWRRSYRAAHQFFCLHQAPWRAVIVIQSSYYGILPHYKRLSTARIIQTLPAKAIMTSRMPWKTLSRTKRATGRETTSPTNAPGIPQSAALTTTGVYSPAAA